MSISSGEALEGASIAPSAPARPLPLSPPTQPPTPMTSFSTYLIGFIVLIVGLAMAAWLLNVPPTWIAVGVVVLIGLGILMATSRTKPKDPPLT